LFYDIANQYAGQLPRDTGVRTSPLRGIGFTANKFVAESFLDEVALKRGADPVQFRLQLLKRHRRQSCELLTSACSNDERITG
jgi:isoquinoline 1-oxidoreductase subunit beta